MLPLRLRTLIGATLLGILAVKLVQFVLKDAQSAKRVRRNLWEAGRRSGQSGT